MQRSSILFRGLALAGITVVVAACVSSARPKEPDLAELYSRSARFSHPDRNPLIVIPGLLGTRLEETETGRAVWGAFGGDYANPSTEEGARLVALPLRGPAVDRQVVPTTVLDRIEARLFGLPIQLKAYFQLLGALGLGGYRDESLSGLINYGENHFTCFQFPYDWRKDIAANALALDRFVAQKKAYVEREIARRYGIEQEVRFDVVAHSLGGLVARHYLRYGGERPADERAPEPTWAGARHVERAILIGTPNAGAVEAFMQLTRGVKFAPLVPRYQAALIATFPVAYQLLPRARHGVFVEPGTPERRIEDILDPMLWRQRGWGLASPELDELLGWLLPDVADPAERRALAMATQDRHLRRARAVQAALDVPSKPPAGTEIYLIAGDSHETPAAVSIGSDGAIEVVRREAGDGRVLRTSALMDERLAGPWQPTLVSPVAWEDVLFLPSRHLGLTKHPSFIDNVLYRLLEEPRS